MPENTFKKILLCLDNSVDSRAATEVALGLSERNATTITGLHVYAAALHTERFSQMEQYLPERYQNKEILAEQRSAHTTLITKGLEIISDSYMAPLTEVGKKTGIRTETVKREGKNYAEILREAHKNLKSEGEAPEESCGSYDLTIMGARGLGTLDTPEEDGCGSVTERVARAIRTDILIVRPADKGGDIVVAIDGSAEGYGALMVAIAIAKKLNANIKAVSAFDPLYHQVAFQSLEGVLSKADGELFKLEEQEKLHTEIIDQNLAALYQDHLETATAVAKEYGVNIKTELLSGKPYTEIIKYAASNKPYMLVMGRVGVHKDSGLKIGSTTEKTLRGVNCSVYITARRYTPALKKEADNLPQISWNAEAEETISRIPAFARAMVRKMAEETATKEGTVTVTRELLMELRARIGL